MVQATPSLFDAAAAQKARNGFGLQTEKEHYEHAETIRELRVGKSRHPERTLFEGRWQ
jgi:hypothetical protein